MAAKIQIAGLFASSRHEEDDDEDEEKEGYASPMPATPERARPSQERMAAACVPPSKPPSTSRTRRPRPRKNSADLPRRRANSALHWTQFPQSANCQTEQSAPALIQTPPPTPVPAKTIPCKSWPSHQPSEAVPKEMRDESRSAPAEFPRVARPPATPGIARETDCPPEYHSWTSAQSGSATLAPAASAKRPWAKRQSAQPESACGSTMT